MEGGERPAWCAQPSERASVACSRSCAAQGGRDSWGTAALSAPCGGLISPVICRAMEAGKAGATVPSLWAAFWGADQEISARARGPESSAMVGYSIICDEPGEVLRPRWHICLGAFEVKAPLRRTGHHQ